MKFIFKRIFLSLLNYSEKFGLKLKHTFFIKFFFGRFIVDMILFPSDVYKVFYTCKKYLGIYPNILFPKSFNENLQSQKLFNRRISHITFADKLAVRNYVARTIGKEYLNKLIWYGDNLHDLSFKEKLPTQFVIKTNNSSGTNLICKDKSNFDWNSAILQIDNWLKYDHSVNYAEWQYRWIKPKVLIEEFIEDSKGELLDYKFFCFKGKVKMIQIDYDRFSDHKRLLLDKDFNIMDCGLMFPRYKGKLSLPKDINLMINLAEKLSQGVDFLRVDLYDLPEKIVFGELTITPGAGHEKFSPDRFDLELGKEFREV